ncbi:protein YqcC [Enterobacter cloacae]|uniref:Protein YqcC n=1 Tax=Enterobacter cloacae TaxID=550 RepID=A0A377LT84_ENTCL|nr:protein YqcC [Enterobacter cloacae]
MLIPRMHALLEGGHPLPQAFAVSPYYEMALEATHPRRVLSCWLSWKSWMRCLLVMTHDA